MFVSIYALLRHGVGEGRGGVLWVSESHMVGILSGEWAVAYGFLDSGGKWMQRGGGEDVALENSTKERM